MSDDVDRVVSLHQSRPHLEDVVQGLRGLADLIERGEIEFPVSTAVVVLGHTDSEKLAPGTTRLEQEAHWQVFGYGVRTDTFTVRGLLTSAQRTWDGA